MLKLLCPDEYLNSIHEISKEKLGRIGARGLIVDLDNTLVAWNKSEPDPEVTDWLKKIIGCGYKVCILSNSLSKRAKKISDTLGVPAVSGAIKPRKSAFLRALNYLNLPKDKVVVIGDQIFTDILGGNIVGIYTMLVTPISKSELITTRFIRKIERYIIVLLKRRGHL